jgi:tetratricopeptide (TPR) repeat protein
MHLQFRIILLIALIAMTTDFASAQNSLLQRLDAMMKIGQISWLVTAGEQALTEGQLQQAHAHFAGALERVQAVRASGLPSPFNGNGDSIEGTISSYLGAVAIYRDDFGTAVPYLVRSYQLLERAVSMRSACSWRTSWGWCWGMTRRGSNRRRGYWKRLGRWFDDHGKPSHAASALANLCGLHMDNGDLDLGADRCRAAIERFEHGAAPAELAMVRAMFAVVQSRRGDYADASVQLKKALEENQGHADATTAAKVLGNVGSALTRSGPLWRCS